MAIERYQYIEGDIEPVTNALNDCRIFGLDLETTGLNPLDSRILLCQISTPSQTFVINWAKSNMKPLAPYLISWKWLKIIQNVKFEYKFLKYHFGVELVNFWDTYLAEILSNPDARNSSNLGFLANKYLGIAMQKETRKSFYEKSGTTFTTEQLDYAALDSQVLIRIYESQKDKIHELNLDKIAELEFQVIPVIADMELTGVPIDVDEWKQKIVDYKYLHEQSRLDMHDILFRDGKLDEQLGLFVRDSINLNSPVQLKKAFIKIGINIDSTNEREISLINHPAAQELLRYREYEKILSAYGDSFLEKIHPFTNRIHADFQQLGTETGRFSCKDPNLQQLPEEFRACITHPQYMIVGADYSQIELRILAELSGDEAFIRAFQSGNDLHKETASVMFNIPVATVTKEQRFMAKTINFGISYGMGPGKLLDILNSEATKNKTKKLTFPEAKSLMDRYHKTYRRVSQWLIEAGNSAYINGYSETMLGRKRFYSRPDINGISADDYAKQVAAIKRKGANSPIQGTNADITKLAMVWLHSDLKDSGYDAKIILQVHDEVAVLARKEHAEAVKSVVEASMLKSAQEVLKKVPVKAEAYISEVWKK